MRALLLIHLLGTFLLTTHSVFADDTSPPQLTLRCVTLAGEPVSRKEVRLQIVAHVSDGCCGATQYTTRLSTTSAQGRIEANCEPRARRFVHRQSVVVMIPGFAPSECHHRPLVPGESYDIGDVVVRPGVRVSGHVTGPDHHPLVGATVSCDSVTALEVQTDDHGWYELPSLPPGNLTFQVSHEENRRTRRWSKTVTASARQTVTLDFLWSESESSDTSFCFGESDTFDDDAHNYDAHNDDAYEDGAHGDDVYENDVYEDHADEDNTHEDNGDEDGGLAVEDPDRNDVADGEESPQSQTPRRIRLDVIGEQGKPITAQVVLYGTAEEELAVAGSLEVLLPAGVEDLLVGAPGYVSEFVEVPRLTAQENRMIPVRVQLEPGVSELDVPDIGEFGLEWQFLDSGDRGIAGIEVRYRGDLGPVVLGPSQRDGVVRIPSSQLTANPYWHAPGWILQHSEEVGFEGGSFPRRKLHLLRSAELHVRVLESDEQLDPHCEVRVRRDARGHSPRPWRRAAGSDFYLDPGVDYHVSAYDYRTGYVSPPQVVNLSEGKSWALSITLPPTFEVEIECTFREQPLGPGYIVASPLRAEELSSWISTPVWIDSEGRGTLCLRDDRDIVLAHATNDWYLDVRQDGPSCTATLIGPSAEPGQGLCAVRFDSLDGDR